MNLTTEPTRLVSTRTKSLMVKINHLKSNQFQIFKIGVFQETAINLEVEKLNFSNRLELFYSHKMNILNEEVGVVANQLIDLGVIVFGGIKSLVEK